MKSLYRQLGYALLILPATIMTVACDDSVDYELGPPAAADCMKVYFNSENSAEYVLEAADIEAAPYIDVIVSRANTASAADVPVQVEYADECFVVPESVHFDAGEAQATLKVGLADMPVRQEKKFFIRVADEYVDPYAMDTDGIGRYNCSVIVSEWLKIVKDAEIYGYYGTYDYLGDIYWLAGANRFRFTNFLESGVDMTFSLGGGVFDPDNKSTWSGYLVPLDNYEENTSKTNSYGYFCWYLYDDANAKRLTWKTSTGYTVKNVFLGADFYDQEFNIYDGNIDGIPSCHGWLWVDANYYDYVYVYYSDVNIDGYTD